jgi:phosphatidate cytidylyltransferase
MSYLDPHGGHASRDDWSSEADSDGRDDRPWARHTGAAPDPYADDRVEPPVDPDDPYAEDRRRPADLGQYETGSFSTGSFAPGSFDAGSFDTAQYAAYAPDPYAADRGAVDDWAGKPAATSTSQAEYELVADPNRPRGRGRRRAGRDRAPEADAETDGAAVAPRAGRAGRNLRAAIVVGCSLGAVVLAALYIWKPAFLGVIVAAAGVGIWEMVRAIRTNGAKPPLVPLLGGGVLMIGLAWFAGSDALTLGLVVTVLASLVWRIGDGRADFRRDLTATVLIAVYVPFLLGFGALLIRPDDHGLDGSNRVLITLLAVVLSDTGGYAAGVFFGKRPMAPKVSPKKSWEGFAGSVLASALGSALLLFFLLDVPFYWGVLFGMVIAAVAVVGDLAESMMKRDLRIKDMSQLLPGHGGLMDRLDSILFAVPTAYVLLTIIAPTG